MRVVWALSFLNNKWTELQYRMLIASVKSWKKYNSREGDTCVLYGSLGLISNLKKLNVLDLWDEVIPDMESYLSGCFTKASWDYPKVEALYRESQKSFYIDYDILFRGSIRDILDPNYCWFWDKESTNFPWYYGAKERIKYLPAELDKKVFRKEIAYNTGILFLDFEYVKAWKDLYMEVFPTATPIGNTEDATKFSLTIGQSSIVGIVPSDKVKFLTHECFEKVTHFLGWEKYDKTAPVYNEWMKLLDNLYPEPEFTSKFRKMQVV